MLLEKLTIVHFQHSIAELFQSLLMGFAVIVDLSLSGRIQLNVTHVAQSEISMFLFPFWFLFKVIG